MLNNFNKINSGSRFSNFIGFTVFMAILLYFVYPVSAGNDLLLQPSKKTKLAVSSCFLDVANTGKRLVAVGERGHIVYSDDKGISWTQADVPVSVVLTAVQFVSPEKGWAAGHDAVVLHTEDGGQTWKKQFDGFKANELDIALCKEMLEQKKIELEQADEDRKEDLQLEVEDLEFLLGDLEKDSKSGAWKPLLDIWFDDDKQGFALGIFGTIYSTDNGGKSWQSIRNRIDNPDTYHLKCITRAGDALMIGGEVGVLFRSMDKGRTWEKLNSPLDASFFGLVSSPSSDMMVGTSFKGNAFLSRDKGENWEKLETGIGATIADGAVLSDGSIALASYSGHVLRISGDNEPASSAQKLKAQGTVSIAEAEKGFLVVVGKMGITRVSIE